MNHHIYSVAFILLALFICCSILFTLVLIILNYNKKVRQKHKTYLRALMNDRERTYQQFATELHDNISNLAATAIVYTNRLSEQPEGDTAATLKDLKNVLQRLHIDAHNMSRGFVSGYIAQAGLLEVMQQELSRIHRNEQIQTCFKVNGFIKRIPDYKKVMLYRIFQESLMNSLKYAGATKIWVKLYYHENGTFDMKIADNGRGFNMQDEQFKAGVGINSMQERASLLKGRIDIRSRSGTGTLVHFNCSRFWTKDDDDKDMALIHWHTNTGRVHAKKQMR